MMKLEATVPLAISDGEGLGVRFLSSRPYASLIV